MSIHLDVVSAESALFSGAVMRLSASGIMGDLGIEPGHAPLLTLLKPGVIHIVTEAEEDEYLYVSGGVLEVQGHCVTILADSALRGQDLDEAAARQAEEQARRRLEEAGEQIDYAHALAELKQAVAQLRLLDKIRK